MCIRTSSKSSGLRLFLFALAATWGASSAVAGPMACNSSASGYDRTWVFDSAEACGTGQGNPNSSSDIENLGGLFDLPAGSEWTKRGDVTESGDNSSWLDVMLTSGSWGGKDIEATWSLAAGFWDTFSQAVFTVHVGHGSIPELSDFGAFIITPGEYSGLWEFAQLPAQGGGGGLSNAAIWTTGSPPPGGPGNPLPSPAASALLALGFLLLVLHQRRARSRG